MAKTRVARRPVRRPVRRRRRWSAPLIVTAAAWTLILLLRAGSVFRSTGSVVFLLVLTAALVYTGAVSVEMAKGGNPWRRVRRVVLVWLIVGVPVAFDPTAVEPFNPFKYMIVTVGALAIAASWVIEWMQRRRPPVWRNGLQWPILALVLWTALATATSSNVRVSLLGYRGSYDGLYATLAFAVIAFAFVEAFAVTDLRKVLSVLYFGAGGPVVVYGILQLHDRVFGGARWDWVEWGEASFKGSTIWSTFGNPNHLAGFLAILLPIGLVLFFLHRDWRVRGLIGAITLLSVMELLQTTTRGAWLASFGALALTIVMVLPEIKARPRLAAALVAALVVSLAAAGFVLASTTNLRSQLGSILDFGGNSTAVQRVEIWKAATDMATDRPLTGFGPDTFRFSFYRYQTAKMVSLYGPDQVANGAHNVFMNYLATEGFPGVLAFAVLVAVGAARAGGAYRRLRRRERDGETAEAEEARRTRLVLVAIAAGTAAHLVQALFNTQKVMLTFTFWVLLGMLGALAREVGVPDTLALRRLLVAADAEAPPTEPPQPGQKRGPKRPRGRPAQRAWVAPAGLAVAGVAAFLAWTQAGPYRAEHPFREALILRSTYVSSSASPQERESLLQRSRQKFDEAIAANPWDASYPQALGILNSEGARRALAAEGGAPPDRARAVQLLGDAASAFRRAITIEPSSPSIRETLARILVQIHDFDASRETRPEAIRALREAVRINPWQPRYAVQLGGLLSDMGQASEALRVLDAALARSPESQDALRQAARIADAAGLKDRAQSYWERLLALAPDDADAKKALGKT